MYDSKTWSDIHTHSCTGLVHHWRWTYPVKNKGKYTTLFLLERKCSIGCTRLPAAISLLLSAMGGGHLETAAPSGHGALWIETEGHPLSHLLQKPNLGLLCIVVTLITFRVQRRFIYFKSDFWFIIASCTWMTTNPTNQMSDVHQQSQPVLPSLNETYWVRARFSSWQWVPVFTSASCYYI